MEAQAMQARRAVIGAWFLVALFVLQSTFSTVDLSVESDTDRLHNADGVEWVQFDLVDGVYGDAVGVLDQIHIVEDRSITAHSRIGTFDLEGLHLERPLSSEWLQGRSDLRLFLINESVELQTARTQIEDIAGLSIREFISPSGLVVQGTPYALNQAGALASVAMQHSVPLGLLVDDAVLDVLLLDTGATSLQGELMRIEGWRDELGPVDGVNFIDATGAMLAQNLGDVAPVVFEEAKKWDEGRYEGTLATFDMLALMAQPSMRTLQFDPAFIAYNNNARSNMKTGEMTSYFTTDLDGSGQIVAVADSGLDEDHGDFGTRVVGNNDVIGDGSTADKHSGHGTHVSCTVLGDGAQGGYAGVAPEADLFFQAMENDNTGNFQSPSLNYLLNSAYSAGARTHTNSWGSSSSSDHGKYTSSAEDVDDRANYYDRYYNGRDGLTILFAAGNDGPNTGTVGAPATAKNTISVGNHQNRYSGAPDTIMSGSSRGPTDDGRIKPDLIAPGGYVRSCRAQEATDTGSSTWSSTYYLEYTGTSMATPNAAGAAAMIREYLEEIAQRPSPQGALVKALMVLGATDVGSRDVPNDNEGWGKVNLRETLAPTSGQGIWVDDRSVLSGSGNSKSYTFNITQSTGGLKTVLTWSDERGSTFSSNQLVNNLDLELTSPSGVVYLGNDFANGRSTTGGNSDSVNNLEVVLLDSPETGVWTVKVKDTLHGGGTAQPFAIAVRGHGVNDLRPDPEFIVDQFSMSVSIPQVGDQVQLTTKVFNVGNVKADFFDVEFRVDGGLIDTKNIDIGAGSTKTQVWYWTPQDSGETTLSFIIDPDDDIEEILENNNQHDVTVDVTAPGVKLTAETQQQILLNTSASTTSWNVTLTNTALISTNASMSTNGIINTNTGQSESWYVGATESNFSLEGQDSANITVTLVHPSPPSPGAYRIDLLGLDVDNGVTYPYHLDFIVPELADLRLEYDYQIVPVSPSEPTSMDIRLFNIGNADIGYDLFLQAPAGWSAGFDDLASDPGATSGSTGLIPLDTYKSIGMTFVPPQVMTGAGAERIVQITAISQTEIQDSWVFEVPIKVEEVRTINIDLETNLGVLRPDSAFSMMFSVEHRGNIDMALTPSFELPTGWSVVSGLSTLQLDWTTTENILIGIEGDGTGRSGDVKFHLDSGSDRSTWAGQFDVEVLPDPSLQFVSLMLEDGTSWTNPLGPGSHPAGQPLVFTWLASNAADVEWAPTTSISLDNGLFGECLDIEPIGLNGVAPVVCTVLIPATTAPLSEPGFSFTLSGNGVERTEQVGLYVASVVEASWVQERTVPFETGENSLLEVTLTNSGNTAFSHQLKVQTSKDWAAIIDGNDVADLEPGQSMTVRLLVEANQPGTGSIDLYLVEAGDVSSSSVSLMVESQGEPTATSGGNVPIFVLGPLVFILLGGMLAAVMWRRNKTEFSEVRMPIQSPVAAPLLAVPHTQPANPSAASGPMCWSCRTTINGPMQGCPGCGARYHRSDVPTCQAGSLQVCTNCSAPASTFVLA
jgi:uncharacterized membrane protein